MKEEELMMHCKILLDPIGAVMTSEEMVSQMEDALGEYYQEGTGIHNGFGSKRADGDIASITGHLRVAIYEKCIVDPSGEAEFRPVIFMTPEEFIGIYKYYLFNKGKLDDVMEVIDYVKRAKIATK